MALMTTREFIQHLVLNGELDDPVQIEVRIPANPEHAFYTYTPTHVTHLGDDDVGERVTLIDCKLCMEGM